MTNAVDIENVSLVFGGEGNNPVLAVDTINIAIPKGQFVAIVGPSGCGKTTVLNMLSGLIPPTAGSVKRNGKDVDGPSRDVGYMLARSALSPWRRRYEISKWDYKSTELIRRQDESAPMNLFPYSILMDLRILTPRNSHKECGNESQLQGHSQLNQIYG